LACNMACSYLSPKCESRRLSGAQVMAHNAQIGPQGQVTPRNRRDREISGPYDQHRDFDLRLVAWPARPCRQDRGIIMCRHLGVGPIDLRLVEAGLDHSDLGVVWHQQFWHPADCCEGSGMGADPVGQHLRALVARPVFVRLIDCCPYFFRFGLRREQEIEELRVRRLSAGASGIRTASPTPLHGE